MARGPIQEVEKANEGLAMQQLCRYGWDRVGWVSRNAT